VVITANICAQNGLMTGGEGGGGGGASRKGKQNSTKIERERVDQRDSYPALAEAPVILIKKT